MESSAPATSRFAKTRRAVLFLIFAALAISYPLLRHRGRSRDGEAHPAVGRQLTQFPLHPLTAETAPVNTELLEGRVVLLNYWGTWCFPCRMELPHLAELYARWQDEPGVRFLFVSCEDQLSLAELTDKTLDYLAREGHELPVYADPGQAGRRHLADVAELGERFAFPTTVVLDGQHRIRGLWQGYVPEDTAAQAQLIKQLLRPAR
jgi:cytochrome c biogenesis protein CcmG, thiol:disulfide interchange protein DsbE